MNTIRRKWSRLLLVPLICIALILLCGCSGAGRSASAEPQKLQELSAQEKESGTEEDRETGTGSEGEGSGSGDEDYYENDDEDYLTDEDPPEEGRDTQKSGADIDENGVYTTKEDVALYLHTYGHLPHNFMTKKEARSRGWSGGALEKYAPGMCIGGDRFGNYEGILPDGHYHECDINTLGEKRGPERLVYSDDGRIYYTADHYETFELLY